MSSQYSQWEHCDVCGNYANLNDESDSHTDHNATLRHKCNMILADYKERKKGFLKNRNNFYVSCDAEKLSDNSEDNFKDYTKHKIMIKTFPNEQVKFTFTVTNEKDDALFLGLHLAHPQPNFQMSPHPYLFDNEPFPLKNKQSIKNEIIVTFTGGDVGQYEMPIMFTFRRKPTEKKYKKQDEKEEDTTIIREMVIHVQDTDKELKFVKTPFKPDKLEPYKQWVKSTNYQQFEELFKIPKDLKTLLPNFSEDAINRLRTDAERKVQLKKMLVEKTVIFNNGFVEENFIHIFQHLLWWEEIMAKIKLKKYNMPEVKIDKKPDGFYWLDVPGLAEKRPSVLRGDKVIIRPLENVDIAFESVIQRVKENCLQLGDIDAKFSVYYRDDAMFNIRFMLNRVHFERMHEAVCRIFSSRQGIRVFPKLTLKVPVKKIEKFYNPLIRDNAEQRSAVENIVSMSSGLSPYIVFGPPGTGKTMTIVEAIIQIVVRDPKHRVLVCTDSNMAADHIAVTLLQYNKVLNINNFILRASSQDREWSILPPDLIPFSNGCSRENFTHVSNAKASTYRILVTTLFHSAKYSDQRNQMMHMLRMSHLFIDEAAQALEPAALVPITGLLAPLGQLVLAGDPKQLGPICMAKNAKKRGLGRSLLERLWDSHHDLYRDSETDDYKTVLVKNFRSHPDILKIPNELFYNEKPLQPRAAFDELSETCIFPELPGGESAVVFHAVNSKEQRMGNAPSFFNEKELEMLQRYTIALVHQHNVSQKDIGIIAPYIRQVYKMRDWLEQNDYKDIEIGSVEAFQGKEKRVILVSTVRANCRMLDYDAKYDLGFLIDDKRFNVALTRAKAKLVIVGNPACLDKDVKWKRYMSLCEEYKCYYGREYQQMNRTSMLLEDVAIKRFKKCRLDEQIKAKKKKNEKQN